jgi:hypothetical protein
VHTIHKNAEALTLVITRLDQKKMVIKLSAWSCLELRVQEDLTV